MDAHDDLYETSDLTAYKIVNEYSEDELERIMRTYGEERWARRIAKFIVEAREEHPIESTDALTEVIKKAIPKSARRDGPHPSKRTFQSIRIEVNGELDVLSRAINRYIDRLNSGGRLAIITFHSLEDRIVKELFLKRENPCTCDPLIPICTCGNVADAKRITRKPIVASEEELAVNHRSRSAKLRIIEKQ
jgi:16S rRNA (cytosine1402-N4)-methyltransferase